MSEHPACAIDRAAPSAAIEALLHDAGLPTSDIRDARALDLFVVRDAGDVVGVIGLESYGVDGLLRSLVVLPSHRGHGLARALVAHVEAIALERGMTRLYLLTNTAPDFFMRCGYEVAQRADAPLAIASTKQFAGLCPSSATFMQKALR